MRLPQEPFASSPLHNGSAAAILSGTLPSNDLTSTNTLPRVRDNFWPLPGRSTPRSISKCQPRAILTESDSETGTCESESVCPGDSFNFHAYRPHFYWPASHQDRRTA